jgi:hypothetical protein
MSDDDSRLEESPARRRFVESCWVLDVNDLTTQDCLRPGLFTTCQWHDDGTVGGGGGGIFTVHLRYKAGGDGEKLHLSWRSPRPPDEDSASEDGAGEGSAGEDHVSTGRKDFA